MDKIFAEQIGATLSVDLAQVMDLHLDQLHFSLHLPSYTRHAESVDLSRATKPKNSNSFLQVYIDWRGEMLVHKMIKGELGTP